ncbi:MAG: hypothetical protein V3S55_08650, partial [Nitrospiraceae bacterium]
RIPTYAMKQVRVPHRFVLPFLLLVGLIAALLVMATWFTISAFIFAYLVSIPFSVRSYRRLANAAAREGAGRAAAKNGGGEEARDADSVFEDIADDMSRGIGPDGDDGDDR